jgi:hypothetical protein
MIDAERLDEMVRRADDLRRRQSNLDDRASEHRNAARTGTWDATVHKQLEDEYDRLGKELASLQADLDRLLSEDEADD